MTPSSRAREGWGVLAELVRRGARPEDLTAEDRARLRPLLADVYLDVEIADVLAAASPSPWTALEEHTGRRGANRARARRAGPATPKRRRHAERLDESALLAWLATSPPIPAREREVAELLFGERLTTVEVAARLGLAPSSVRTWVKRLRRRLSGGQRAGVRGHTMLEDELPRSNPRLAANRAREVAAAYLRGSLAPWTTADHVRALIWLAAITTTLDEPSWRREVMAVVAVQGYHPDDWLDHLDELAGARALLEAVEESRSTEAA